MICDAAMRTNNRFTSNESTALPMQTMLSELSVLGESRPTVGELVRSFATVNNVPVVDRVDRASMVFDLSNVDSAIEFVTS